MNFSQIRSAGKLGQCFNKLWTVQSIQQKSRLIRFFLIRTDKNVLHTIHKVSPVPAEDPETCISLACRFFIFFYALVIMLMIAMIMFCR